MPDYRASLGFGFLKETALSRKDLFAREREVVSPSPPFKEYPQVPKVPLPKPVFPQADLFQALVQRRSKRRYQSSPLGLEELALILFAAQGVTARSGPYLLRTAPSAGALYPVETYIFVNRVEDLSPGLYHLEVRHFVLETLRLGQFGEDLASACLGQKMCATAAAVLVWTALPRRTMSKYGSRGVRYIFMDVAHICQNVLLAATALGLGACPIGAFFDDELNALLDIDGEEEIALYLATVGRPRL